MGLKEEGSDVLRRVFKKNFLKFFEDMFSSDFVESFLKVLC